eukprot:8010563-Pyramimonas_sp.AAC.1
MVPRRPNMLPIGSQDKVPDGPRRPQKGLQMDTSTAPRPPTRPRGHRDCPREPQGGLRRAPMRPKRAPRQPQGTPKTAPQEA